MVRPLGGRVISARLRERWTELEQGMARAAERRYGYTELRSILDETEPRVRIEAVVHRLGFLLADRLRRASPRGLRVAIDVAITTPAVWHRLHAPIDVLERPPSAEPSRLTTELMPSDGPVGVLFEDELARLVRATDGTVGWTRAALGECVPPPRLRQAVAVDGSAWVAAARTWLGRPYRWGGTTTRGLDCSGLVQRSARACGLLLPRHSGDQLGLGSAEGPGSDRPGTLVFVWSEGEAAGHVMLATGEGTFVHASSSRGAVIEDARTERLAVARHCMHVPLERLAAFAQRSDGAPSLADAFVLGRRSLSDGRRTAD